MILEFISPNGNVLRLTGNDRFKLSHADGLTTVNVELASSIVAGMDGDIVNSKRAVPRSIVLELSIESDVENVKRYILQYVKAEKKSTLRMTQEGRTTVIEGIVEAIEMQRFTNQVVMQITMYCSQPFWQDENYTNEDISENIDLHYFTDDPDDMLYFPEEGIPFGEYDANRTKEFVNDGDADVGIHIKIVALGHVSNPTVYNSSGEFIGVVRTLEAGDEVTITTEKGNKTITLNGQNIISDIKEGSTWLQLKTGEDELTIDSDDGTEANMYFTIIYKQRYV